MTTLLAKAEALGRAAKGYLFGAEGPTYYDCSGLVWRAALDIGEYTGARFTTYSILHQSSIRLQFHQIHRVDADVNDIVVWSTPEAHGHMGVISGPDRFYSAESVKSGIGFQSISGFHVYPVAPIYLRPNARKTFPAHRELHLTSPQMHGSDVETVQRVVGAHPIDGWYGPITTAAVKRFQAAHGLDADGRVGPLTWPKILAA